MKKHLINFSFVALSVFMFLGGLIIYQKYSSAAENPRKEYQVNDGDVVRLSDDISLTVNKNASVPEEALEKEPAATDSASENPPAAKADSPAELIDLANWKYTLPTGKSESPAEIFQPKLAGYSANPYFCLNPTGDGVVCRAPVNGVSTSNSGYPRSELREMANNGKDQASWSTKKGTHALFIDQAITSVPQTKKHVVAGQIHGSDDDVIAIRLEYPKLFVDVNGKTGPTLDSAYQLGKRFNVKFVAENGMIKVYYNGSGTPIHTLKKSVSGCYFKAGAYTQSNCDKEKNCSENNFGEVVLYDLKVTHS